VTPAAIKPVVSVDDLGKIDIRVGTIVAVHEMTSELSEGLLFDIG
jgi:hypothetical protein